MIKNIGGKKTTGRNYEKPMIELLPEIIGKKAKPITVIADEAQRSVQTVRQLFKRIKEKGGVIHIGSWQRGITGGQITACYLLGPGDDAPKIKPLTRNQISRRYQKTDKGRAAKQRFFAKKAGVCSVVSKSIRQNPLMSILYG